MIFNRFQSVIAFKPTVATILSPAAIEKRAEEEGGLAFDSYEVEGPDRGELLLDLSEFQLAATLYNAMLENATSELGSRMQSMENSTKNAQDMLARLTLFYNRTRQARNGGQGKGEWELRLRRRVERTGAVGVGVASSFARADFLACFFPRRRPLPPSSSRLSPVLLPLRAKRAALAVVCSASKSAACKCSAHGGEGLLHMGGSWLLRRRGAGSLGLSR